jgi:predicted dehydrogenase
MSGTSGGAGRFDLDVPDHRPRFPEDPALRGGVAILGAGTIAQSAHLPAYETYGVGVTGVWSRTPATSARARERFPFVEQVYDTPEQLLADPRVRVVDIATPAEGRMAWVRAAVEAGKHVLAQKPLTTDPAELAELPALLDRADEHAVRVAVNHNGRWAPAWRLATLLVRAGAVGEVVGVTHLHDKPLPPLVGTPFDDLDHMLLTDYLMHWIDITRCWLEPGAVASVQATDGRVPGQPAQARNPWSATIGMTSGTGASAVLRIVGDARAQRPSCPFWIHGTEGTLRGSVLIGSDRLSLDRGGQTTDFTLHGQWFVDGFAGTMGELLCAIAEDRAPENSAADAAASVRVMLAARDSADRDGVRVHVEAPA